MLEERASAANTSRRELEERLIMRVARIAADEQGLKRAKGAGWLVLEAERARLWPHQQKLSTFVAAETEATLGKKAER